MRAFLALAARWERVERWNILGGFGGGWFGLVRLGIVVVVTHTERVRVRGLVS